jgi:hypothetical protein
LDHRADRRIACAHTLDQLDGALRVGRAFHINAQKIFKTRGALHDGEHQTRAEFTVDVQAKLREFAGDVGLDVFLGDGLENREILVAGTLCVGGAGNILAEIIQASHHARVITAAGSSDGVLKCLTGNEAARQATRGAMRNDPRAEFLILGKLQECGPNHAPSIMAG